MLLLDGISVGDKAHEIERVHPFNVCDKAFKSLRTSNQHIIWQHIGLVFVYKSSGKKFKTNNNINRHKKIFGFKPHHRGRDFATFPGGARGRREKGQVCPAPGRGQTSSIISIRNIVFIV